MRGIQICHYLAKGLSIKVIAGHLNLKREIVDERLKNLRRKYGCETTYQLMALLGQIGLVKVEGWATQRGGNSDTGSSTT